MRKLIPVFVIIFIAGIFITGCGGPGYSMNSYLYVACEKAGAYGIATFKIGNNGILTPVTEAISALMAEITSMVADHRGSQVYAAHNVASGSISNHTINESTGELFLRLTSPILQIPQSLAIDPSDRFLGCTYNSQIGFFKGNDLSSFVMEQTVNSPYGIAFNPLSNSCYVTKYNDGTLLELKYDPDDGLVYDIWESDTATGGLHYPAQVVVHPNGQYIYIVNQEITGNYISGFQLTGTPDRIKPLPKVYTSYTNLYMAIDPAGRYLYSVTLDSTRVLAYHISSETGQLTLVNDFELNPASAIKGIAVAPNGQFVYISDYGRDVISMFRLTGDATVLTPIGTDISTYGLWSGRPGAMATALKLQ